MKFIYYCKKAACSGGIRSIRSIKNIRSIKGIKRISGVLKVSKVFDVSKVLKKVKLEGAAAAAIAAKTVAKAVAKTAKAEQGLRLMSLENVHLGGCRCDYASVHCHLKV